MNVDGYVKFQPNTLGLQLLQLNPVIRSTGRHCRRKLAVFPARQSLHLTRVLHECTCCDNRRQAKIDTGHQPPVPVSSEFIDFPVDWHYHQRCQ